ncbi:hypothetical protein OROHE_013403 [Orobanche hederae]
MYLEYPINTCLKYRYAETIDKPIAFIYELLIPASSESRSYLTSLERISKASGIGFGNTVSIDFCSSCSYSSLIRTHGINVVLANYPAPFPKRTLSKLVPVVQFGVIGIIMGGEHIFPRLGFSAPPRWYYSMRANRFGSLASTWLLGNFLQSFVQNSGAFEVYCNSESVFSKLNESRFPGEIELKELVARRIANSRVVDGLNEGQWS